jgi:hypothetical protein
VIKDFTGNPRWNNIKSGYTVIADISGLTLNSAPGGHTVTGRVWIEFKENKSGKVKRGSLYIDRFRGADKKNLHNEVERHVREGYLHAQYSAATVIQDFVSGKL